MCVTIKSKLINCPKRAVFVCALLVTLMALSLLVSSAESRDLHKRSFTSLGCLGVYDKAKFARLNAVCQNCYQLYYQPALYTGCRQECFNNDVFDRCVTTLRLENEREELQDIVDAVYGKR